MALLYLHTCQYVWNRHCVHSNAALALFRTAEADRVAAAIQQQEFPAAATSSAAPPTSLMDEESTSAGGNLLHLRPGEPTQTNGSQNFFSQLNWQGREAAGYVAYQDQEESSSSSGSSSSSSSESEEETFPRGGADPFSEANKWETSPKAPPTSEQFANFGAMFGEHGQGTGNFRPVQPQPQVPEEKLIEFSFTQEEQTAVDTQQQLSSQAQQAQQKVGGTRTLNGIFGEDFDPWKGSAAAPSQEGKGGSDFLLNLLGDSDDEHSHVSLQSECRAVGTETFIGAPKSTQPMQSNLRESKSASGSTEFDPFGPTPSSSGGGDLFELLAPSLTPLHPSTSAPNLSQQQPAQVDPGRLRRSSQDSKQAFNVPLQFQQKPTFGRPNYTPGLKTISGSQENVTSMQFGGRIGYPGSETTSPYSTSPRSSPIPFGAHSSSTGNLAQGYHGSAQTHQPQPNRLDPFADLGNVKLMKETKPKAANPMGRSAFQPPMTSRPTYQMYSQVPSASHPPPSQLPRSQSPRPFQQPRAHSPRPAFGSVFGDSDRGGNWSKTGKMTPDGSH